MKDEILKHQPKFCFLGSLIGLGLGFLFGITAKQAELEFLFMLSDLLEPIGNLWINALRMIVVPLIIAYIVTASCFIY